ncbi:AAEL012100-PA [Aedes aegypti]|uniref:AAEL012100-PA n=2 Tax=Aedes aegypti TaxID=7159 RepID=A0A1S4FV55_AEDAE|nr:MKI67 FHA domain-interacting nucleolar phosphoprotein [Aedes aegypti]EAT35745.1 AAEL012100-PA [Aedes aegypti]
MKNNPKMPAVGKKTKVKTGKVERVGQKPLILSNRSNKPKKPSGDRNEKGIIYMKHLPHGFFENQLRAFFSQFGHVTRVHVARSKRTLRSRGYAYVEFLYREVAQIAAETMNNYLMFGKLLKTGVLPAGAKRIPRKYEKAYDANGKETTTYNLWLKKQVVKSNARVTKTKVVNRNLRALGKLKKLKEKYAKMGIEYNVDEIVPVFGEDELKMPEHDAEEEEIRAKKVQKKAKQQQKVEKVDESAIASEDSSDDDEEAGFMSLESADWDVPMSDDDESSDDEEEDQENKPSKNQTKSAAVDFAKKTKVRIDKEKQTQKGPRPSVLKAPSSTDASPEKPISKKKVAKAVSGPISPAQPESSPEKAKKGPKSKVQPAKAPKSQKAPAGGVTKKPNVKKDKPKEQKKATSSVKSAAKALLKDPSVKKAQAKNINKKKKK